MPKQLPFNRFRSTLIGQISDRLVAGLRKQSPTQGSNDDAWEIEEWKFPRSASVRDQLLFLIQFAVLAPSVLNRQPWKFRVIEDRLLMYMDTTRSLPSFDPERRELIMSCGAALFHLRAAMTHYGYTPRVRTFPTMTNPDVLAEVRFGEAASPSTMDESLFMAIRKRRTHRQSFLPRPVEAKAQIGLIEAAAAEDATLTILHGKEREKVAALIFAAQSRLETDREYNDEVNASNISAVGTVELEDNNAVFGSQSRIADPSTAALDAPILAVLCTSTDTVPGWLTAGQALDRILLTAREYGLFASFLNQPLHFVDTRREVAKLAGQPVAQMILRIGYGTEPQPTDRDAAAPLVDPPA